MTTVDPTVSSQVAAVSEATIVPRPDLLDSSGWERVRDVEARGVRDGFAAGASGRAHVERRDAGRERPDMDDRA